MAGTRAPRSVRAGDGKESLLIYVHGIGKHEPKEDLKHLWDLALFGRDLGARSRMAYWEDVLRPKAARAAASRRNAPLGDQIDLDVALGAHGLGERNDAAQAFARGLLRHLGVQESGAAPGKKVLPLPAWLRKPLSRAFLEAFVGDTAAYFFDAAKRRRIRQRLLDELPADDSRPVTIVSHSQGSIIAYEVLCALKDRRLRLDAWITIGSPLGLQEVQDYLEPDDLRVPDAVTRWHNFADPLDPVALDKGLATDFRSARVMVEDAIIVNSKTVTFAGFNPHSAVGYLSHPKVRRVVNDAMRMDMMAPFVIARDVAERLGADPGERHPVLIEVLEPGFRALDETPAQMEKVESGERARLTPASHSPPALKLEHRIRHAASELETLVSDVEAARIDPLRRFVAAHLTATELRLVAMQHKTLRVYSVWQSSRKAKLTGRSMRVLKADAAITSFNADGNGITWAVLDTGIRADHPHFDGVIAAVWDCTQHGPPRRVKKARDPDGHGTHVAGIISGTAPKGGSQRGVAPKAKLVIYKVLDDKGQGEDAWIIKALDHITEQNENVASGLAIHGLNLSLGGPFDASVYGCGFSPICAELRRLWRGGVLVVAACGNEGQLQVRTPDGDTEINTAMSIGDPANLEDCIAVGSVNADRPHLYGVSSFSSRGPTADGRAKPDVVAPGERISSCNARFRGQADYYYLESGTSMAAPHVSGLLAAFLSVRKEFRGRPDEVKRMLLNACTDIGRDRYHQGHGIPNLMQMLLSA